MNTVQGTVTLQISELDTLRENLKNLVIERDKLKETEKQIKINYRVIQNSWSTEKRITGGRNWDQVVTSHLVEKENLVTEGIEFKNLEDLREAFKADAKVEVFKQVENLNSEISTLNQINVNLKKKHEEALSKLGFENSIFQESIAKEYKQSSESYRTVIKELEDKIKVLEGEEIQKSKDKLLEELKAKVKYYEVALQNEKSLTWWDKLLRRTNSTPFKNY